jgi:hypothetical protein
MRLASVVVHSVPERRLEIASSVNLSEAQDDATKNPKQTGVHINPHFLVDVAKAAAAANCRFATGMSGATRAAGEPRADAVGADVRKFAERSGP